MKTICICSDNYPTNLDPTHPFVEKLCCALSENGIRVIVVAPQSIGRYLRNKEKKHPLYRTQKDKCGNIMFIYQPIVPSLGSRFKWLNERITQLVLHILFLIIPYKPDVFYGHFWRNAYKLYPLAKLYKKPLYVATGESIINFCRKKKVSDMDTFVEYISGVICVSSKNRDESIEIGLTDGKNCKVIPNAIDSSVFYKKNKAELRKQYGYNQDEFIVVFVGWWINRKGPQRVADAIKMLDLDIKSFFIGGPNSQENIEPECPGILFKGTLNHLKVSDYLNMADVFVLPTLNEGCCNAVIEAMACGLPIISSNKPFNWDVLNSSNSILIDPENVEEIANAISVLYSNEELRYSLSANALVSAQKLSLSERAKTIINFIKL